MDALIGVKNFLSFLNDNWTLIIVIAGLCVALGRKVKSYISLSNDEKIEIAKTQISESILKMITDAEKDYDDWVNAGAIKRSQVIKKIFEDYPILNNMTNQEEVIKSYVESERYEAAEEAENAAKVETAKRLLKMGKLTVEDIAVGSGLTVEEVEELAGFQSV